MSHSEMKPIVRFNASFLEPIYRFVAKNDVRYYLCGINVKPAAEGGVILSATDGHTAIMARDPNGYAFREVTLSVDRSLVRAAKTKGAECFLATRDGLGMVLSIPFEGNDAARLVPSAMAIGKAVSVGGQFPDFIGRVIPEKMPDNHTSFAINPDYLARFVNCFQAMKKGSGKQVKERDIGIIIVPPSDANTVVRICTNLDGLQAVGVIMPMRNDIWPDANIEWAKPLIKKRVKL